MVKPTTVWMNGGGSHRTNADLKRKLERAGIRFESYGVAHIGSKQFAVLVPLEDVPKAAALGFTVSTINDPEMRKLAREAIQKAKQS